MRKVSKTTKKPKKVAKNKPLTDAQFFEYLANIEKDRNERIGTGQNIPFNDNKSFDSSRILENETLILDKKGKLVPENKVIKKKKSARTRAAIKYISRNCTKCGNKAEVPSNMETLYCYDASKSNSDKPFFVCKNCGG